MTRLRGCLESLCKGLNTVKEKAECLLAPLTTKRCFLCPFYCWNIYVFPFLIQFFVVIIWGFLFCYFFFNMHCCFRLPGCLGSDSELRACKLWGGDLWMATLKVGWSLNLCSSQGGKKKDLRNKEFLKRHLLNSVIFKILMQNLKCIIEWWSTFCVDVKHAKANQWMRRPALGRLLETTATPLTLGRSWCMLPKSTSFGELQGSFGVWGNEVIFVILGFLSIGTKGQIVNNLHFLK